MAKTKQVVIDWKSDLSDEPAEQTVQYAVNGTRYEIDLTETEAKEFHEMLAPHISVSRVKGSRSAAPKGDDRKARAEETAKIREWAAGQGIELTATGRIPNEVRAQYAGASGAPASEPKKRSRSKAKADAEASA